MADPDSLQMRTADIVTALALLTRLPTPLPAQFNRSAAAAWAYPLVGLVVGAIAALTGLVAISLGLPVTIAAGTILAAQVIITGAMHEDGLADTCDGFWGGWDPARRLEIMRDSHIGTYGVIALILSLGLRWIALSTLIATGHFTAAIIATAILSRAPMVAIMHALPHARADGLSHSTGRPTRTTAGIAILIAVLAGLMLLQSVFIPVLIVASLTTVAITAIARVKIGGQTGDVLGATQQLSEIAILATLAALLA